MENFHIGLCCKIPTRQNYPFISADVLSRRGTSQMMKNTAALLPWLYQRGFFVIENLSKQILVIKTEMLCGQVLDLLKFSTANFLLHSYVQWVIVPSIVTVCDGVWDQVSALSFAWTSLSWMIQMKPSHDMKDSCFWGCQRYCTVCISHLELESGVWPRKGKFWPASN